MMKQKNEYKQGGDDTKGQEQKGRPGDNTKKVLRCLRRKVAHTTKFERERSGANTRKSDEKEKRRSQDAEKQSTET